MIQIDKNSDVPLHEQIADTIEAAVRDGSLRAERNLPSVRALAERLNVSPATVSAAYRDLIERRIVEAHARSGHRIAVIQKSAAGKRALLPLHRIEPRLELHPVAEFGELVAEEARRSIDTGGYEDYRGYAPLREQLGRLNENDGISADAENGILISNGAQHAIALAARTFAAGGRVAIEDPVYPGARLAFSGAGALLSAIPMTDDGPTVGALEAAAKAEGIDLFYCCPTYGNPSGRSWSIETRKRVIGLARKYGFLVLEDDYLRDLDYLGEKLPPLATLAKGTNAKVLHVRTFSKCLLPALRMAGISAAPDLIDRLLAIKTADDVCGSAFLQRPLARYLEAGRYKRHLERVRPAYTEIRRAIRERAKKAKNGLRFENPDAGLCLLATLPEGVDAELFAEACRKEGTLVSPGNAYWAKPSDGSKRFRIGFGSIRVDETEQAFSGMERAVERARDRSMENFFKRALL
ncbi:MAG: PLP-dependent aminotransferase family protein [Treponemataceae bacterium]